MNIRFTKLAAQAAIAQAVFSMAGLAVAAHPSKIGGRRGRAVVRGRLAGSFAYHPVPGRRSPAGGGSGIPGDLLCGDSTDGR